MSSSAIAELPRLLTGHVTPPSSLRPCLCPCTPGTRPPSAPRTWDLGRSSIPDTRGTHPPRGRAASSTRCAQCSPSSSGCQLRSSAPLMRTSPSASITRYPSHGAVHIPRTSLLSRSTRLAPVQPPASRSRRRRWGSSSLQSLDRVNCGPGRRPLIRRPMSTRESRQRGSSAIKNQNTTCCPLSLRSSGNGRCDGYP